MTSMHASPQQLDVVFKAVSDGTRRAILRRLSTGPSTVQAVASEFPMSLPAVSKHIRILEGAGLIDRRVEGRTHHLTINAHQLQDATEWLNFYQQFWAEGLDSLERFLKKKTPKSRGKKR